MPVWLIKTIIALVFGPPLFIGVLLLIGGAWYMAMKERLEEEHDQA